MLRGGTLGGAGGLFFEYIGSAEEYYSDFDAFFDAEEV